jgi:membrane protein DedA with SNARE-associated domain
VPAIAFIEAIVGVGFFIPGVILLSVCTILYTEQIATLQQMLPLAFCGALLSDHCGFYIGRLTGRRFHKTKFAHKRAQIIEKAEANIVKYGAFAIFFGRFMTPIRSIVPLLTGASGMPRLRYTAYDVFACAVWTLALGGLVVGLDTFWG